MQCLDFEKYPIGHKYISRDKRKNVYEIVDHLTTYNKKSDIVNFEYLCQHDFLGQIVESYESHTTVKMATVLNGSNSTPLN